MITQDRDTHWSTLLILGVCFSIIPIFLAGIVALIIRATPLTGEGWAEINSLFWRTFRILLVLDIISINMGGVLNFIFRMNNEWKITGVWSLPISFILGVLCTLYFANWVCHVIGSWVPLIIMGLPSIVFFRQL